MENDQHNLEALVQENLRLVRENNKLLRKMHRAHLVDVWFRILLLLVAIGAPIFIYQYYLEDFVKSAWSTYEEFRTNLNSVADILP